MTVPVPVMSERRTALVGGLMVAIGPVSMALYTPALPALVQAFDTSEAVVKLSLTVYFAGFSFAQLVCGPLSDAFGRRPISVGFLVLYIAASLVAVFAPTIEWLLAARLVQGIGASVGVAISRAIVRDQYIGQTSARIMNAIAMTLALGPAVSPTLGGLVLEAFGWHEIFWLMVAFGVALVVLVLTGLPETNRTLDRAAVRPVRLLRTYVSLLGDRRFLRPSLAIALTIGVFYTLATVLPFVLIDRVGLSPSEFGYAMLAQSGSFILGTIATSRLLRRQDAARLVPWGFGIVLAAAALTAIVLHVAEATLLTVMAPVAVFAFGLAFVLPSLSTDAIAPFARNAGAASALMGFLQIGGGLAGSAVAAAIGDPVLALATLVPAMPVLGFIVHVALRPAPGVMEAEPELATAPLPPESEEPVSGRPAA